MRPLNRWQRFVAWILPWFEPDEQERRLVRAERLAAEAGRVHSMRAAYGQMADRLERRRVPRR